MVVLKVSCSNLSRGRRLKKPPSGPGHCYYIASVLHPHRPTSITRTRTHIYPHERRILLDDGVSRPPLSTRSQIRAPHASATRWVSRLGRYAVGVETLLEDGQLG